MRRRNGSNRTRSASGRTLFFRLILLAAVLVALFLFWKYTWSPQFSRQGQGGIVIGLPGQPNPQSSTVPITSHGPNFTPTPLAHVPGLPYVKGNQIIDGGGHPVLLRGAHITSAFNFINAWNHGADPFGALNPGVFAAVRSWGMNVIRIPLSYWVYLTSPADYMAKLDKIIQEANAARLYVVIDNHDDDQSGSPYGSGANIPKPETIAFWRIFASHYKYNPMIFFDIINEPKQTDWNQWLHGGGTVTGSFGKSALVIGMQDIVDAIRGVGAPQIIIAEAPTTLDGFSGVGSDLINDPNIVYSIHEYFDWTQNNHRRSPAGWDVSFGNLAATHPVYIGEWAFLPNANHPVFCENITAPQADALVWSFLNYMQQHRINWTAWNFDPYHLIQDYTNYTPTSLDIPWTCGNQSSHAGMGSIVKQFLAQTPGG